MERWRRGVSKGDSMWMMEEHAEAIVVKEGEFVVQTLLRIVNCEWRMEGNDGDKLELQVMA